MDKDRTGDTRSHGHFGAAGVLGLDGRHERPEQGHPIDPVIVEYVTNVTNRFGAGGLDEMISLASRELEIARAALQQLGEPDPPSD